MMHVIKKLCMITALLLLASLPTGVYGASKLPKNFPVNIIPIPKDAIIDNHDSDDQYDMLISCAKYTIASEMINFYHDNLKKTIFDLNEALSKDGQNYWFWGDFDNGNACFCVVILNADNTDPENATGAQISVLLKKPGEIESYWKIKKDFNKKSVMEALK